MTTAPPNSENHAHRIEDLPDVDETLVAEFLRSEAAIYLEAGEFYFRNPRDLGIRVFVNWFNEVAQSPPERRWAALEMLALYGLSATASIGGLELTDDEYWDLVQTVSTDGPLKADLEHAANDVIALLESGADPAAELPAQWGFYRHVLPAVFVTVCLVFAVLTLEIVRAAAADDQVDPAEMWTGWLMSNSDD